MHELVHHHYPDGRSYPHSECPLHDALHNNRIVRQLTDTMFRKDGSSFLAEISAQPVAVEERVVGVVVTFRELIEMRQQEEDLRRACELAERQNAELNAVMESMPYAVYIASLDAKVRSNRQAKAMSGEGFPSELNTLTLALSGKSSTETVPTKDCWIQSVAAPIVV